VTHLSYFRKSFLHILGKKKNMKRNSIVDLSHFFRILSYFAVAGILGVAFGGCSSGVGDPCTPESAPATGFTCKDFYVEASSVQCETRLCGVFQFAGTLDDQNIKQSDKDDRIFCTCRCRAPNKNYATCSCPDGYVCSEDILQNAGDGLRGGYCMKKGLECNAKTTQ
jgi:hypothetical protein